MSTIGSARRVRQRPDGSWIGSGLLRPDEVAKATGITLPEHESYDTIAGLLVKELGKNPSTRGDQGQYCASRRVFR
ncbi:MAG: transporter associated domain-containing protein [Marmoricola sp.]